MSQTQQANDAREKLLNDLRAVIADAEQLLSEGAEQTEHGYRTAIAQFERKLRNARAELARMEEHLLSSGKNVLESTDRFVEDHPWQAVGVGLLAGVVAGLLLGRK
ncbi:MAG: DUF883 domain-containing protein [Burkholderiaceae bacterium]|jgi:ElaB/YqjD/DUF883 family membrane-anchored ribosome-binding protein